MRHRRERVDYMSYISYFAVSVMVWMFLWLARSWRPRKHSVTTKPNRALGASRSHIYVLDFWVFPLRCGHSLRTLDLLCSLIALLPSARYYTSSFRAVLSDNSIPRVPMYGFDRWLHLRLCEYSPLAGAHFPSHNAVEWKNAVCFELLYSNSC